MNLLKLCKAINRCIYYTDLSLKAKDEMILGELRGEVGGHSLKLATGDQTGHLENKRRLLPIQT